MWLSLAYTCDCHVLNDPVVDELVFLETPAESALRAVRNVVESISTCMPGGGGGVHFVGIVYSGELALGQVKQ